MVVNNLACFNKNYKNNSLISEKRDSIFNNANINVNTKLYSLADTLLEEELNLIDRNYEKINLSNCDLLLLTEPKSNELTEQGIQSFIEEYRRSIGKAQQRGVPIIHFVTNPRWFFAFYKIINENDIKIFVTPHIEETLKITDHKIVSINEYFSISHLIQYSNEIHDSIILDLTNAYDKEHQYKINFKRLLNQVEDFAQVDIIISDQSYAPTFQDDRIDVFKESEYGLKNFKERTYVYYHSNRPYSTEDVNKILFYAANSKIIYTNYNYYINNLLPSVIMNLSKETSNITLLPDKEAFDILNENRNTVLFNNSIINILNNFSLLYLDNPYILKLQVDNVLQEFVENIYFEEKYNDKQIEFKLLDYKYDLEKTLMLPILFLGEELTIYGNSRAILNNNTKAYTIPLHSFKTNISTDSSKDLSIIVPIHNNGKYLKYKCLHSITRLSCLDNLEIIFVDDGSSDEDTVRIVKDILNDYPTIVYKRFEQGSGSASRPRNTGMEIATGEYITFLDPDNEAIEDGYSVLYNELKNNNHLDMVVGNIVREDNIKRNDISYYKKVKKIQNSSYISNPKKVLLETNLAVQSIQALIVKKKVIEKNMISMVEGAAGQDTLFFQELLLKCNDTKVIDKNVHSYYAFVEGSVTNTVSPTFFEKFYKVEVERYKFLKRENLIEFYMDVRFNSYIHNWYLTKYSQVVGKEDRDKALTTIKKVINLYADYNRYFDETIQKLLK